MKVGITDDHELEKAVTDSLAEVKKMSKLPQLKLGKKSLEDQFAEVLLSKVPSLTEHSKLPLQKIKESIAKLYHENDTNASLEKVGRAKNYG